MSFAAPHLDPEMLLRSLDDDLSGREARQIEAHLGECGVCRDSLAQIEEISREYARFHDAILKASCPPPPRPWNLDLRVVPAAPAVREKARVLAFPARRWLAAAAAIVAIFFLVRRFERAPGVRAAELLAKAASVERAAQERPRAIRVRARGRQFDRPGRLAAGQPQAVQPSETAELRRLFESAGYDWNDPLSARAFAAWRERVAEKRDEVTSLPGNSYLIRTVATDNPIMDASLTLRADDLHAVSCTLRFGSAGEVSLSEVPPLDRLGATTPAPQRPAPAPGEQQLVIEPLPQASPGDELRVIAALHGIGADLGEPVEVRREASQVQVQVTGLDGRRQEQIRAALAGIPAAHLQVGQIPRREGVEVELRPAPQVDAADPLLAELQVSSATAESTAELSDRLVEQTEVLIERVYALRGLARRFPAQTAAWFTSSETNVLDGIVRDHAEAAAGAAAAIRRLLAPIVPGSPPGGLAWTGSWQDFAEALVGDARRLDQALHAAGSRADLATRKLSATQALADLDRRLAALRAREAQ
jgi:hypothetical protein